MEKSFGEMCREQGGRVVQKGESAMCRLEPEAREEEPMYRRETSVDTSETVNGPLLLPIALAIAAVFIGAGAKLYAIGEILNGVTTELAMVTFVPFAGLLFADVPMWVVYAVSFSWLGVIAAAMIVVFALTGRVVSRLASIVLFGYVLLSTVTAGFWAAALTFTSGTFDMVLFSKLFLLTKIGPAGLGLPLLAESVFVVGSITWIGVVFYWMIGVYSLWSGVSSGASDEAADSL